MSRSPEIRASCSRNECRRSWNFRFQEVRPEDENRGTLGILKVTRFWYVNVYQLRLPFVEAAIFTRTLLSDGVDSKNRMFQNYWLKDDRGASEVDSWFTGKQAKAKSSNDINTFVLHLNETKRIRSFKTRSRFEKIGGVYLQNSGFLEEKTNNLLMKLQLLILWSTFRVLYNFNPF